MHAVENFILWLYCWKQVNSFFYEQNLKNLADRRYQLYSTIGICRNGYGLIKWSEECVMWLSLPRYSRYVIMKSYYYEKVRKNHEARKNSDDAALSSQQDIIRFPVKVLDILSAEISSCFSNLRYLENALGFFINVNRTLTMAIFLIRNY